MDGTTESTSTDTSLTDPPTVHRRYGSFSENPVPEGPKIDDDGIEVSYQQASSLPKTTAADEEAVAVESDVVSSPSCSSSSDNQEGRTRLTKNEVWNLLFCILAWACTIANVTLVVGTSNVVLLSIEGDPNLSSVPLAAFFLGASLVSFLVTPWHFSKWGRKTGFLVGVALGLLGSALGCLSVFLYSTLLLIVATALFGTAMGIGFYLRFAAVEVVPRSWADRAVTLVVSGGCIAAFAGPESAEHTRGVFGGPHYEYMGVFVMTGVFNLGNLVFTSLVSFPDSSASSSTATADAQKQQSSSTNNHQKSFHQRILAILKTRHFILPMLVSAGSWIIMALPMSVLRVVMHHVGFSSRQSLIAIELHFLGMYAPGFFSGQWIARYGPRLVAMGPASVFLLAISCLQRANQASGAASDMVLWIVGMVLIGVGWNCAFSASTVGSTRSYASRPDCKSVVQAANDGLTFLLAGGIICCASFIYQAGGEGLEGWRTVNWIVLGFIGVFCFILVLDVLLQRADAVVDPSEMWSTASMPLKL